MLVPLAPGGFETRAFVGSTFPKIKLVGAQPTPTLLRPFARHLVRQVVIQAAHDCSSQFDTIRTAHSSFSASP